MIHSVLAVPSTGKIKRESYKSTGTPSDKEQSNHLFSQILEEKMDEQKKAPMDCHTLTYGQDSRLHTFYYQSREYNY